ncbi:hypothetical protein GGF32_003556 [Allomyces javanicus]|nr:hypothetical protein GGF32_003556 [Allomyces javanicus]
MISPKSKFSGALLSDPRALSPAGVPVDAAPLPTASAPPAPPLPPRARAMSMFPAVTPPPPPKPAAPLLPKHEYTTVLRNLVIAQRHMLDMQHGATAVRKGGEGRVEMRAAALQKVLARLAYIPPPARAAPMATKGHQRVTPPLDPPVCASTSPPPPPVARSAAASPTSAPGSPTATSPAPPASPPGYRTTVSPSPPPPAASPPRAASPPPAAATPSSPTRRTRAASVAPPRPGALPRKPASPTRGTSPTRSVPATDHDDMLRALHAMGDKYARLLASDDLDPTASLTSSSTLTTSRRRGADEPTVLRVMQPQHRHRSEKPVVTEDDDDARVLAWLAARDLARDTFRAGRVVHVAATDAAWQRRRDLHARMVAVARVNRGKGREVAGDVLAESGAGRRARFAPRAEVVEGEGKKVRNDRNVNAESRMDVLGAKYSVRHTLVPRTTAGPRLPATPNSTDAATDSTAAPSGDWNLWTPARRRARLVAQTTTSPTSPSTTAAALPGHGVLGWEPLAPRAAFDGRAVRYAAVPARAVADALPHLAVPASAAGGNEVGTGGSVWDAVRVWGGPLGGADGVVGDGPVRRGVVEEREGKEEGGEEEEEGGEVVVGELESESVGEEEEVDRGGEMVGGEGEDEDEGDEDWGEEDDEEEEDEDDGEDEDGSLDIGGDSDIGDDGRGAAETIASTE